jgi:hypothetical protein
MRTWLRPKSALQVASKVVRRATAALMFVPDEDERYCGVEDTNRRRGLRERAQREREERPREPQAAGTVGVSHPAAVPAPSGEDPGPTPTPDKPGYPEPAHLGPNLSRATTTRDAGRAAPLLPGGGIALSAGLPFLGPLTPTPTTSSDPSARAPHMTAQA